MYLEETTYLDYRHPLVQAFMDRHSAGAVDDVEKARNLYYAVRDEVRYDPYVIRLEPDTYKASYVLEQGRGYCIQKAALYAAVCRGAGIPARPGFADVRNHIATRRLLELVETNLFMYHGYVEILLNDRWIKTTPAFNLGLCEKFHIRPLEFDGEHDSLLHEFDADGQRHMEYVRDHGTRPDIPVAEIVTVMKREYPKYFRELGVETDFEAEAAQEHPDPPP